ncbi:hypothetical protein PL945_08105 [Bifidobacterium adolescentis]|nr:hypothetical protein [Bifidobacterium adolescentis]MDB1489926.1 hypothetical protein [Bifidobacterium adolescentis]
MMNGITNPMINAANVGSANRAHHFRIALPAMLIIACLLSFLSIPTPQQRGMENQLPQIGESLHCFFAFLVFTVVIINSATRNVKRCHFYMS